MKNIKESTVLAFCLSLILSPSAVFAAPQDGKVAGGSANIHQSGTMTTINQSSDRAIINWRSFDIGKNETVRHNMPSANSAGLHRVVGGGGASQIQGVLQSNGNVYLVNPAGVVIHKGARVDANSFVATTRDIADNNFMKGNMVFDKPGRPDAQIINQGAISVKESGLAALVAPTVRNDGVIAGKLAKVALASGDSAWKLDMHGDDLITFTVDEKKVNTLHAVDGTPLAGVENTGSIKAEGGVVVLTAAQLDGIVGSVVNSGEVSAASAEMEGGKIIFKGEGAGIDIVNTGTVDASSAVADGGKVHMDTDGKTHSSGIIAATGGQQGGKVVATGREVALSNTAKIDVSGNTGGGTALVGGNALGKGPEKNAKTTQVEKDVTLLADAGKKGNGGDVVVWADEKTTFAGSISAKGGSEGGNGGNVETSGKLLNIVESASVNTSANIGVFGKWLIDPEDFTIAEKNGNVTGDHLSQMLIDNNIIFKSIDGDINVNDDIVWNSATRLTLEAYNNININNTITSFHDNAELYLITQAGNLNLRSKITLYGENTVLSIDNKIYNIINSVEDLQNINNKPNEYFALGSDIDASNTKLWNNGEGFKPIGSAISDTTYFSGVFNGLGHTISELTINRPTESHVGLFGFAKFASVSNIGLENASIVGLEQVGSIMGCSYNSEISNSYSTGNVSGHLYVGGFIGKFYDGENTNPQIINCYTTCDLKNLNLNSDYFGGFCGRANGWDPDINYSYSTGFVPHTKHSGGFIGYIKTVGAYNLWNNFYDKIKADRDPYGSGGDSKSRTTSEMQKRENYGQGWDFTNVWTIEEGKDYPKLKLFASVVPEKPVQPSTGETPDPGTGGSSGLQGGEPTDTDTGDRGLPEFEFNINDTRPEQSFESIGREYLANIERLHNTLLSDLTKNTLFDLGLVSTIELSDFIKDTVSAKDLFSAIYNVIGAFKIKDKIEKTYSWQLAYGKAELSALLLDHAYVYLDAYKKNKDAQNIQTGEMMVLLQNAEELLTLADAIINSNITFDLILNEAYDKIIKEVKSTLDKYIIQDMDIDIESVSKNQNLNKILHTADYWGARTKSLELITKETVIDYKNSKDIVTKFSEKIVKNVTSNGSEQFDKEYSPNEIIDMFIDSESIYEIHNAISDKYSSYAISNNIAGYDPSKVTGLKYVKDAYLSKHGLTQGGFVNNNDVKILSKGELKILLNK